MTMTISVVGMFCEDIREEKGGAVSLIGVMPDNLSVPEFKPGQASMLSKLCLYVRIHYGVEEPVKSISLKIVLPEGTEIPASPVEDHLLREAYETAKKNNGPICAVIIKLTMSPFAIRSLGWLKAIATIDGRDFIAANARFNTDEPAIASETIHQGFHRF